MFNLWLFLQVHWSQPSKKCAQRCVLYKIVLYRLFIVHRILKCPAILTMTPVSRQEVYAYVLNPTSLQKTPQSHGWALGQC